MEQSGISIDKIVNSFMNWSFPSQISNYINGVHQAPLNGQYLDNICPSTGGILCQVPDSHEADVDLAYQAAQMAFKEWSALSGRQRFEWLHKIAKGIEARMDQLVYAESLDNGKPHWLSKRVDIPRAAENFDFFATAALQFASESHFMEHGAINYTLRQPIGVVGCISPWNLPLYLFTWKIAPALAAGNCVVAKPSEVTPLTAYLLSEICIEIGLPKGVLNIVHGGGQTCGAAMVSHPKIKAISFTGSTRAGAHIAATAAPMFKKLSLELGGKNAAIVFEDCDWKKMMSTIIQSSFSNQGQICLCGSRVLVQKTIYEQFKAELLERVQRLKVGQPFAEDTKVGAIVSEAHYRKILDCIELAKQEGGRILYGGHAIKLDDPHYSNGFYIAPTIIEGLTQNCKTNQEEIFGPVITIEAFEDAEDAIEKANNSHYGLSTSIWTQNLNVAHELAQRIQVGIVWINCWLLRDLRTPFGGMKDSGVGREGGWEAMRFFTEPKNVCIEYGTRSAH